MSTFRAIRELKTSGHKNTDMWVAEAKFGYENVKTPISLLSENSNILEVGCGSGILSAMLKEESPTRNFIGLEPFGNGFDNLKELNSIIGSAGINILNKSYEEINQKFSFIYCINVFKHLVD